MAEITIMVGDQPLDDYIAGLQAAADKPPVVVADPRVEQAIVALQDISTTAADALELLMADPQPPVDPPVDPPVVDPVPPSGRRELWLFLPNGKSQLQTHWLNTVPVMPDRMFSFHKVGSGSDWSYERLDPQAWMPPSTHPFPTEIVKRNQYFDGGKPSYALRYEPQDLMEDMAAGKHAAWERLFFEQLADLGDLNGQWLDLCPGHEGINATWGDRLDTEAERAAIRAKSPDSRNMPYKPRRSANDPWQPDPRDVQHFADWVGSIRENITRTGARATLTFNPNVSMNPDGTPSQLDYEPMYLATRGMWDAIGLDGYNGTWLGATQGAGIDIFRRDIQKMQAPIYDGLPVGIYETGNRADGPNDWWSKFFADLDREFPDVNVVAPFEVDKETDWRVAPHPARAADFERGAKLWLAVTA